MKSFPIFSSLLAASLAIASPGAFAHVGHGDEFQSTGGINRVEVKAETDSLLGIQVAAIEADAEGSETVLIPVTALVDDSDRQLVFVQYENFYEPVDVVTGETKGELIEVTEGLSLGEQLVTQGSLSLYAESRKTQAAEAATGENDGETASETGGEVTAAVNLTEEAHAEADAKGIPHEHEEAGGISKKLLAAAGVGVGILVGAVVLLKGGKRKDGNA